MARWFIGLMSGTSLDGVDGVLAEADGSSGTLQSRAHAHVEFEPALRAELLALNSRHGADELHRAALAANALVRCYADVVEQIRRHAKGPIAGIGAHGQTVRHRPGDFDDSGYTLQLINGALLAELCGIDVICDFRSRDVAAGGQGAPLVPAFHAAQFGHTGRHLAVLNLGGIANLTLLPAGGVGVLGFDCGPANVLMDLWCQRHQSRPFDDGGVWAATGKVDQGLLSLLLKDPFFSLPPPKSTGRDLFHAGWLEGHLATMPALQAQDVMATLAEVTARGVADAVQGHAPRTQELVVCGGGARNSALLARIGGLLGERVAMRSSAEFGVAPDQVEALAFAWLARAFAERRAGNLPAVTGARGPRILGALYPAN